MRLGHKSHDGGGDFELSDTAHLLAGEPEAAGASTRRLKTRLSDAR